MFLKSLIRNQKPLTVSLISFVLMLLVVVVIGLVGGRHIIDYLQRQLVEHGISHNQEVLASLQPMLERSLQDGVPETVVLKNFQEFIEHAQPFGVRIFLIDPVRNAVLADSSSGVTLPYPVSSFLSGSVRQLSGEKITDLSRWRGTAWHSTDTGSVELLLLHDLAAPKDSGIQLVLGVSSDLSELLALMDELHLHLDVVLLITYGLIGLLGFLVLRWVGRRYEFSLEQQVAARTLELEQAHEELLDHARLATIGQTASVLAHEMRNPLASIKLALSSVSRSNGLSDRERQRVDLVLGEVDRLGSLLNQTLEYGRPVKKDKQPVPMDEVLDKVLDLEQALMEEKHLRLIRHRCPDCPAILIDSEKMQQVLLNLLKNAREASADGGQIQIAMSMDATDLRLEISNTANAFDDNVQAHAFDFFFTTKARGTGLGLGLVKQVVQAHGGQVELVSEEGVITARLLLPIE
ncbi:MAG TPA: GHKL domain-containing protein [Chromatiaceae bacterium]|nr:GHKL domain-containing protein [Chromatiaceae bacterium]